MFWALEAVLCNPVSIIPNSIQYRWYGGRSSLTFPEFLFPPQRFYGLKSQSLTTIANSSQDQDRVIHLYRL